MRLLIPLFVIVQSLLSIGIVFGFSFLMPELDKNTSIYLTTGAPTVILLSIGLVVLPQGVAELKTKGTFEYMLTWPLPRLAYLFVDAIVWLLITIPGIMLALFIASFRFDLSISLSWLSITILLFVGLTAIGIGYALSVLLPPAISQLLSQVLIIGILLFSPINFPVERLPQWLETLHSFLPIEYMANAVRGALSPETFVKNDGTWMVLTAWCLVGFLCSYLSISRRK
ncbi:ABC transporter permease [Paraliobacillus sp. JSM ZJ581]|uniref:ABC transporter permease n=1 Tax=Paraliobacillus sp. JSM ZJ581 TaxID=3342118 RepID=UPI0035A8267C